MNRAIKRLLLDVVLLDGEQDAAPSLSDMARRAKAMLDEMNGKRRRVLAKSRPRRAEEEAQETATEADHRALVARVMERAKGQCELGNHPSENLEPHHLQGGGNRLKHEKVWNVMAACREHHDAFHMNPRRFVCRVRIWCSDNHYPVPNRKEYR